MERKQRFVKPAKRKKIKINTKKFSAQINCTCKRNCATLIDVCAQKEIFDNFNSSSYSKKIKYLRSISKREAVKENLNPRLILKKKEKISSFYLNDTDGISHRVCLRFVKNVLQIDRTKIFRAVSSIEKNPNAEDRRGKFQKIKINHADTTFMVDFIRTFPCYESKINAHAHTSEIKYFHPSLSLRKIYQLYENACAFKERQVLSKYVLNEVLKKHFQNLKPFSCRKSVCCACEEIQRKKKPKVLSNEMKENIQQVEDEHITDVKNLKEEFLKCILDAEENNAAVLTFQLQRPLEMPCVPMEESYDWRQMWFSNCCIFDEITKTGYMHTWDESIAQRGQEEIASCLFKYISTVIPKTVKTIVLYSKRSNLYRNTKLALMLEKLINYNKDSNLTRIEQRFFMKGHDLNDCDRCFDFIEKKKKSVDNVYSPTEWADIILSAKRSDPKFNVIKMTASDFILASNFMNDKLLAGEEQNIWLSRKDDNFISKEKFDNLQKNLKYIPTEHQIYYQSLKFKDDIIDKDYAFASFDFTDEEISSNEND